jgi:hypothetical protein
LSRVNDETTSGGQCSETDPRKATSERANETIGSSLPSWYPPPLGVAHITANARRLAATLESEDMAAAVGDVAQAIGELVVALSDRMDTESLPPINAVVADDGSALLEWILPDMRIGFTIETDVSESGWFLVSSSGVSNVAASGVLNADGQQELLRLLLSILRVNS